MAAKYFYVKNSLGTRTTGGGLTKQTGTFTALGATNVYATIALALADAAPPVAGDFIVISDADAFSAAATTTYTFPDGVFIISASDTACDTYSRGATQTFTGSSTLALNGQFYSKGVSFIAGSGSSGSSITMVPAATGNQKQVFEDCSIQIGGTGASQFLLAGGNATAIGNAIDWRKVDIKLGNVAGLVRVVSCVFNWLGGSILSGSAAITTLIWDANTGRGTILFIGGVDLSNA